MENKRTRMGEIIDHQKTLTSNEIEVSIHFPLMNLPRLVLHEVLFKLPVSSIMAIKLLSKELYHLISSPYFSLNYTKKCPFSPLLIPTKTDHTTSMRRSHVYLDLVQMSDNRDSIRTTFKSKIPPQYSNISGFGFLATCHGLLCLSFRCRTQIVYICNPITAECMELPRRKIMRNEFDAEYGFGFCRSTNRYKVLRIFCKPEMEYAEQEAHIFTVGVDDRWRVLSDQIIPFCFTIPFSYSYKFIALNGTFHWIVKNGDCAWISTFDLGEEKVGRVPHPRGLVLDPYLMKLESIDNHLYILDRSDASTFVLWKMNEYGVAESWTKDVIVDISCACELRRRSLVPVTMLKNSDVLFASTWGEHLFSYDRIKRKINRIKVGCYGIFTYAPSFLSLKEAVMGKASE